MKRSAASSGADGDGEAMAEEPSPQDQFPLVDTPDDELDQEGIKEKRRQRLLKSNWEARERIKKEKQEERERLVRADMFMSFPMRRGSNAYSLHRNKKSRKTNRRD